MWEDLLRRLEGRLVVLEPLAPSHEAGLYEAASHPEIWRWMHTNAGATVQAFHTWMEEALARTHAGEEAAFVILDREGEKPVGSSRYLTLRPEHRGLEIGFTWMAPSTWGTGENVEAKLLLLEHAIERLGCMRVEFKTDARNERARSALAALPARFEGILRKHMLVRGSELRDSAYYSIVDDEWPGVKAALLDRVEAKLSERQRAPDTRRG